MFEEIIMTLAQYFFEPTLILMALFGTAVGVLLGSIPGLDSTIGCALGIPLTYAMSTKGAFIFLATMYIGAVYGGQIPAILFRIPGASEAIMTSLDGYQLTKKGKADIALGTGLFSSVFGSIFGVVVLLIVAIPLAKIALEFGPAEYFALAILGLATIASLGGGSVIKGLISGLIGLLLATLGIDALSGITRFTFGSRMLMSGISFIPAVIGLFAVSEVYRQVYNNPDLNNFRISPSSSFNKKVSIKLPPNVELKRIAPIIIIGALVGVIIGILPGTGATTAAIIGYSVAIKMSKYPEKFGTGIIDGIAAAESANNSAVAGALVPLLALGIPGSATTAVMLGAFMIHGLTPGPLFLINERSLLFMIAIGMILGSILIIPIGALMTKSYLYISKASYPLLAIGILVFSAVGARASGDYYGMFTMFFLAVLGFFLEMYGFPVAPVVIGLVLGPIAESSLRRALIITNGNWLAVISRPITAFLLILSLITLLFPIIQSFRSLKKGSLNIEEKSNNKI